MYDIYDVTLFFLFVLVLIYWWRISEQKSHALTKAKEHCVLSNLQLLDQTLVFIKHQFSKDDRGNSHLCRHYEFDFSTDGEDRFKGEIMLSGFVVIRIVLERDYLEVTEF